MDQDIKSQIILAIIKYLGEENKLLAVLLFGSRLTGHARVDSDYDLAVIARRRQTSTILSLDDVALDLVIDTPDRFHRKLYGRTADNNNFTLNIFAVSEIIFDSQNLAHDLKEKATGMYAGGPPAISPREALGAAHALRKMLHVVKARITRSGTMLEDRSLCAMRTDEIVSHAIYTYFRVERRWTRAFFRLVKEDLLEFAELHHLWMLYVDSRHSIDDQLQAATSLIEHVCARLDSANPTVQ